jgi:anti-sigma factor RsiW
MNNCETIQASIGRWLDGELHEAERKNVEAHVAGCAYCRDSQRDFAKIDAALKSLLNAESKRIEFMPLWREVQRRINEDPRSWRDDWLDRVRWFFTAPRVAWMVPAAIVLVLGLFSWSRAPFGGLAGGNNFASVDSIDSHGRNVALLRDDDSKTTIIWLYQDEEGEGENVEAGKSGPSF